VALRDADLVEAMIALFLIVALHAFSAMTRLA